MSRRESSRDKQKTKSSKEENQGSGNGKQEKQTKIDTMINTVSKESTMGDLIATMNAFDQKISQLASKDYIDKSFKKLVTEEFVTSRLEALRNDITKEIKSEIDNVHEQVKRVKTKLIESGNEITDLKNTTSDLEVKLNQTTEENIRLSKRNKELKDMIMDKDKSIKYNEKQINELEQYTRRNSIRIYGIDDRDRRESAEQTGVAVIGMLKNKLKIDVSESDIDIAHRLGSFSVDANRPIICKFISRGLKSKVIRARKGLKGSAIVVREDLTFKNAKLLETVSSKEEVKSAWSDEGRIIALLHNGKKLRIDAFTNLTRSLAGE